MATSKIILENPAPKQLTVTNVNPLPDEVSSCTINAYKVGYIVNLSYVIAIGSGSRTDYVNLATIQDAAPSSTVTGDTNFLASGTTACKPQIAISGTDAVFNFRFKIRYNLYFHSAVFAI